MTKNRFRVQRLFVPSIEKRNVPEHALTMSACSRDLDYESFSDLRANTITRVFKINFVK
jgi:hypothetical protein